MAQQDKTPAGRIATAIKGCEPHSIPGVRAVDVVALVGSIPDEKQSELSLLKARSCAAAVRGLPDHRAAEVVVHIPAGELAKLLEDAGVNAQ